MKLFHISDILSVTTGRLVSTRHIDGVYDILNFLTGDDLFTHQLPRANRECEPWLRSQFPLLMKDAPGMLERLSAMDEAIRSANGDKEQISSAISKWIAQLRDSLGLPETLPVYEMGQTCTRILIPLRNSARWSAMIG